MAAAPGAAATAAGAASGGLVNGLLSSPVLGSVLTGLGNGAAAKAESKAVTKNRAAERAAIAANYNVAGGPLGSGLLAQYAPPVPEATGSQAFGSTSEWYLDPVAGRLARRPRAA